jgi:hypothetical protein
MSAQIEIDTLRHRCQLITANPQFDAMECRQRLTSMSESALPNALATLFDAAYPQSHNDKRIIRIRKLSLNLKLLLKDLNTHAVSDILAQQILDTLVQGGVDPNNSPSNNYIVFEDHSHYVASFIAQILQPNGQMLWCFSDFHYASYLTSSESLVALLLEQKDRLRGIARHLDKMQLIESLAHTINTQDEEWLINHWCNIAQSSSFSKADVEFALALLDSVSELKTTFTETIASNNNAAYTRAYLKLLATSPQSKETDLCSSSAHKGLLTLFNMLKHAQLIVRIEKSTDAQKSLAINALHTCGVNKVVLQNMLEQMACSTPIRLTILALLHENTQPNKAEQEEQQANLEQEIKTKFNEPETLDPLFLWRGTSDYAGLGLLLPLIASMQLERCYTLGEIKGAMLYLLREHLLLVQIEKKDAGTEQAKLDKQSEQTLQQTQVWLDYLLFDSQERIANVSQTALDISRLTLGLAQTVKDTIAQKSGTEQLANILMAQFAARLSGLQLSSHAYLFKQFLYTRGSLAIQASSTQISLRPIALNIVLKMSGYSPYKGNILSNGHALTIEVQE